MKLKIRSVYLIIPLLFVLFGMMSTTIDTSSNKEKKIEFSSEEVLKRHNYYRKKLNIPPLEWSEELAVFAQKWADSLVSMGCGLVHSNSPYGENIFWTSGKFSESYVIDYWAEEEKFFNHNSRVFKERGGYKSGHYTQIIWRNTQYMGAGIARCSNGDIIFVCSYDPPGNFIDEKVY